MELPACYSSPPHEGLATNSITTNEFASIARVKAKAIYDRVYLAGHYLGIRPTKLPNGHLRWHRNDVMRVLTVKETSAEVSR